MQKIKIITDSASDISKELEQELNIEIMCFPITVGDKGYRERVSFSNNEFYDIMDSTAEMPKTAQITSFEFVEAYTKFYKEGYTDIINVTISSTGSATNSAAKMAIDSFYEENPEAKGKFFIHVVDSLNYTAVYGYPVTVAALKASKGESVDDIVSYLNDWFSSANVVFAPFTLEYVKKSGRVSSVAGFVGELLGLRPIIRIADGISHVIEKIRGDKNIIPKLVSITAEEMVPQTSYCVAVGSLVSEGEEFCSALTKKLGYPPAMVVKVGAAISLNAGHKVLGVIYKKR